MNSLSIMNKPLNKSIIVVMMVILMPLWVNCTGKQQDNTTSDTLYTPHVATGFEIKSIPGDSSTIITIHNPWQGAEGIEQHYFIQRGDEEAPEGFMGQVIPADAQRIVCLSSTYVAMFDILNEVDRIVGVQGIDYIHNAYINAHRDSITDFTMQMDYEKLVALNPDLVMLYGINDAVSTMTDKLQQLHIPYIYMGEYVEPSPVGKAEWLMIPAEILNLRAEGEAIIKNIIKTYDNLKQTVAEIQERPTVMFNTPWNDTWMLPPADTYMLQLIKDAGATPAYTPQSGSQSQAIGMETALKLLGEADYWLNPGMASSLQDIPSGISQYKDDIKAWREGHIYNNNAQSTPSGGNNFYEDAVVRPQVVLSDLITIFHPDRHTAPLTFYQPLH